MRITSIFTVKANKTSCPGKLRDRGRFSAEELFAVPFCKREHTPAVVLAVNAVFPREHGAAFVSLTFFKVGEEKAHADFFLKVFPCLIQDKRVFMRADSESGSKVIVAALSGILGGAPESESKAYGTAGPALRLAFKSAYRQGKFLRNIFRDNQPDVPRKGQRVKDFFLGGQTPPELLRGIYVGIVVEHINVKIFTEVFQNVCAAWTAATVEEKPRRAAGGLFLFNYFI